MQLKFKQLVTLNGWVWQSLFEGLGMVENVESHPVFGHGLITLGLQEPL